MTKTQAKKRFNELLEKFEDLQAEIFDFKAECETTAEEIEPYESKDDLTEAQQERQEWFENLAGNLEDITDFDMEDMLEE